MDAFRFIEVFDRLSPFEQNEFTRGLCQETRQNADGIRNPSASHELVELRDSAARLGLAEKQELLACIERHQAEVLMTSLVEHARVPIVSFHDAVEAAGALTRLLEEARAERR